MILDFIIGLTLINTIPHFVLGVWKGRMFSGLGFGNANNIGYGILNFIISVSLFLYKYGVQGILKNGIYLGALFVLLCYFAACKLCYTYFHKRYHDKNRNEQSV